ncbi:tetratricopeptide repeat protein [Fundidesulfovibrio agrisoli]|uniref:tetratricopeptide repeat protein n=1 Tax=Fundidesulfovibrio agrisoli TaxID=2922717 RepID=UPI001FAC1F30|nr:tetratricopeptide repeat protein [Fundidesulfovibrio agrisoli]
MSKAKQKTPASNPSAKSAPGQVPAGMVRKQSAVLLCAIMLLAGVFMGWQGAVIVFNQETVAGRGAGQEHGQQPQAGMPPQGMPPQGMPQGGMNAMMGGGQNPMMTNLMAQAKTLEDKAAKTPNDVKVWVDLGNLYFDADLPERSVAAYEKALALDAGQPDVWTDMGVMLRAIKKPQEALKAFQKAVSLQNNHEIARMNIGVVKLYDLGDKAGAAEAWNQLVAINPGAKMPDGRKVADAVKDLSK